MEGRFDLPRPSGTCYFALDPVSAVMEYIGPEWAESGVISPQFLGQRHLFRHDLRAPVHLVNLSSEKVTGFHVTRELATMADYSVPHAWAEAFAGAGSTAGVADQRFSGGFDGIIYPPRFHVSHTARSIALFGPRQPLEVDGEVEPDDDLVAQLASIGVTVLDVPANNAMR
jgi:hypothetical protein